MYGFFSGFTIFGEKMVSTTFYTLVFLAVFDTAMGWVMLNKGFGGYTSLPTWIPSVMIIIVALLTLFIGYMFETYAITKKPVRKARRKR